MQIKVARGMQIRELGAEALKKVLLYAGLAAVGVVMAGPFLWMLLSSFKPDLELFAYPPVWWPKHFMLDHYRYAFLNVSFGRYFLNSFLVAAIATAANVFFTSLAGYAFARLEFFGKNAIFFLLLGTMMIPSQVTLIPVFIIAKRFPLTGGNNILGAGGTGLIDSYGGLLFPYLIMVFGVFLVRQFFMSIPRDLDDAARIDGASEFGIYWRICLPLSRPVLATLAIFVFTNVWDDFLWPLVITNSEKMRTVQLGLQIFQSQFLVNWGPLMAATVVVTLPVLMVFMLGQKYFIRGIATTGLKG